MKIYTKTGDEGQTGLPGGIRVSKDHFVIEACGTIDELNSILGLIRSGPLEDDVDKILLGVQNDLFDLGARVAMCMAPSSKTPVLDESRVALLESAIDQWETELEPLTAFILPDGNESACRVHLARSICRRAERTVVTLRCQEIKLDLDDALVFLNRLSDLLFVLARLVNRRLGQNETLWKPAKPDQSQ